MGEESKNNRSEQRERLDAVIAEYLRAVNAGEVVDRESLLVEQPQLADDLKSFFGDHDKMQTLAEARRSDDEYERQAQASESGPSPLDDPTLPPEGDKTEGFEPVSTDSADAPPLGTKIRYFGDYELLEEIARGGMGVVYKARQMKLNRIVALKMILAGQLASQEDVQRFYSEAESAAQLDHPGIVPIFEVGEHEGQHFFSMGYVDGKSLAHRIADGPLPPREAAELIKTVGEAVQYAHDQGVIHRDLKPANILLKQSRESRVESQEQDRSRSGSQHSSLNAQAVITDFGLAKRVQADSGLTATGQILGTPSYMPPEQAAGQLDQVSESADVYALGAVLYATLTGRPPFQTDNPLDTLMQVLEREPVSPRQLNPGVPRDLETICIKCLDKDRRRRYPSAKEVADELIRFLNGEPILARPISTTARSWRWCRRNRSVAMLSCLALVALICGTAFSTYFAIQAELRARDREAALGRARIALVAEEEARAEALERLREARRAVDRSYTGVSEVLRYYPGTDSMRRELLKEAAKDYRRFANLGGNDLDIQAESGRAFIRLGDVYRDLADYSNAKQAYQSAESVFQDLSSTAPDNPSFKKERALNAAKLGGLFTVTGSHSDAGDAFEKALALLDEVVQQHPKIPDYRYARAETLRTQVQLFQVTDRSDKAETTIQKAAADLTLLIERNGEDDHLHALAAVQTSFGELLISTGRHAEAVGKLQEAIETYKRLVTVHPGHPPYLSGLASARVLRGNALNWLGRNKEAVRAYEDAASDQESLLDARPGVPQYRENLLISRFNIASIQHNLDRSADAKNSVMEALEGFVDLVTKHPSVLRYHEEHAACLELFGRVLGDLGENESAKESFRLAVQRLQYLIDAAPDVRRYRNRWVSSQTGLARLLEKTRRQDDARRILSDSIAECEKLVAEAPDDVVAQDALAWCLFHLADIEQTSATDKASRLYGKALSIRARFPDDVQHLFGRFWLLTHAADAQIHDTVQAIQTARRVTQLAPENPKYWNALGFAYARAQNWEDSKEAVVKAIDLRQYESAADWFVLAMACSGTGEQEQAKANYDRAVGIMIRQQPDNGDLVKLRSETRALLGLSEEKP